MPNVLEHIEFLLFFWFFCKIQIFSCTYVLTNQGDCNIIMLTAMALTGFSCLRFFTLMTLPNICWLKRKDAVQYVPCLFRIDKCASAQSFPVRRVLPHISKINIYKSVFVQYITFCKNR